MPSWIRLLGAMLLATVGSAKADNADVLWHFDHDLCVPHFLANSDPSPCAEVVLPESQHNGWVVFKDRDGAAQYLLMPTDKITGIEDPQLLSPQEPNFFAAAWQARRWFLSKIGHDLPRGAISLAINAPTGRTQNQLHIHIDCLRVDVDKALAGHLAEFGADFASITLAGHPYRARRLDGADLAQNPFTVLADDPAIGAAGLGQHSVVVVGEAFPDGRDGFVMLDQQADLLRGIRGSGEELQDHACAIAQ